MSTDVSARARGSTSVTVVASRLCLPAPANLPCRRGAGRRVSRLPTLLTHGVVARTPPFDLCRRRRGSGVVAPARRGLAVAGRPVLLRPGAVGAGGRRV